MLSHRFSAISACLLVLLLGNANVNAHGSHASAPQDDNGRPEHYAEYHMRTEHHLDAFDLESFFKLHDLNRDNILDRSELEAIYGVHHETSRERSGNDEEHQRKSNEILNKVLAVLDQNGDGVVTKTEFVAAGPDGLPEFSHHEGLGHHYDSEGEYFLHHEELYHNTPETQTEDAYTHAEDLQHFAHHEDIEREEEDRARRAQGLPATDPNRPLDDQTEQPNHDEIEARRQGTAPDQQQQVFNANGDSEEQARQARAKAAREQTQRLNEQKKEAQARGAWTDGNESFRRPKDKVDRLRAKIPYKFKARSSLWGDF